jgi:hypothetical protein
MQPSPEPAQGGGQPPRQDDPWHIYHFVVAIIVVASFLDGVGSLVDLWKAVHKLNGLQESGLAASVTLLVSTLRSTARQLAVLILRLFRR